VDSETQVAIAGHLRCWRIVGGEKGPGVEVEGEAVVSVIEGGEQIPLVPSDTRHALEEGVDIDADRGDFLPEHRAAMKAPPARTQRAREVAKNVEEKTDRGDEALDHEGQSYRSRPLTRNVER